MNRARPSRLRLVRGAPAARKTEYREPALPPIPFEEFDQRLSQPWARAAAHDIIAETRGERPWKIKEKCRRYLDLLCQLQDFLAENPKPTWKAWGRFLAAKPSPLPVKRVIAFALRHKHFAPPTQWSWYEAEYLRYRERVFALHAGTWREPLIKGFADHLDRRQKMFEDRGWKGDHHRFTSRSKRNALVVANRFLEFLTAEGLTDLRELDQSHVDRFIVSCRYANSNLPRFLRFLVRRGVFITREFEVKHIAPPVDLTKLLGAKEVRAIRERLLAEDKRIQHALVGLLILYYGQTGQRATRLTLSQIREQDDGTLTIRFHKVDVPILPAIAKKLRDWMEIRRNIVTKRGDDNNPFLFIDPVQPYLPLQHKKLGRALGIPGANLKIWRATAILNAYRHGVRNARDLVDTLGVSIVMATRYLEAYAGARLGESTKEEHEALKKLVSLHP